MPDEPVTEIQAHDQVLLVAVQKRSLDEAATRQLVDDVLTAAGQTPRVPIVLDLSRVRFAPSVALGSLVQLAKSFKLDRRRIALIGVDRRIYQTIRVTQLHEVLEIRDSLEQVIDASDRP
jgi:anti-anti-sigma factor